MGFFSWKCAVTGQSIACAASSRGPTPCVLVCPDSTIIQEDRYNGYGDFGEHDVYELIARWHGREGRKAGIAIACDEDRPPQYPIKVVALLAYTGQRYEELRASEPCEYQGFFYRDTREENKQQGDLREAEKITD